MKGVLWGWLLALGAIFWASMIGLDYFYLPFINHNSTIPEDIAVPIDEALAQNYLSKYVYQVLTVSAVFGIAFYINRRFFKKNETNIINVKQITVNEEQEMDNADESMAGEEQTNKNTLEVNNNHGLSDDNVEQLEKDIQESFIIPPTVDVRELQARLKEFENNLALLKQKGERLVNHTEMQKKRWEELNAGDQ